MVDQIATITTEIIASYTSDFDGITIDTLRMVHPDGTVEIRYGWTELMENGQTVHFVRTQKGAVLNGNWSTVRSNKWMTAYKTLKPATQPRPRPVVIPVIPMIRSYTGKAFSSGRIKSNPDLDITEEQYQKIMSDARKSLGW
jgi:saccharopine dehydrogenase-like NADP-dependent oxidoreductase